MASTAAIQSPADLCNNALARMGYKLRIGSLYDGSAAAKKFLDTYSQTRDELLETYDYDFSERTTVLTLLKSAPPTGYFPPTNWDPAVNPPFGFAFEYAFPSDAIKIRTVKPQSYFALNADPQPHSFQLANDNNYTPGQRVVLCSVANAVAVYTGQVTNPTTWNVSFCELLSAALSRRLGPVLVGGEAAKMGAADEQASASMAQMDGR
jgi:hypothetical protein